MLDARFGLRLHQSSALLGGHGGGRRHPHHKVLHTQLCGRDARLALAESRGARSVKRLLAERGVTPEKRETIPVLCVDGAAAAVWGVGTDRSFLPEVSGENIYYIIMGEN